MKNIFISLLARATGRRAPAIPEVPPLPSRKEAEPSSEPPFSSNPGFADCAAFRGYPQVPGKRSTIPSSSSGAGTASVRTSEEARVAVELHVNGEPVRVEADPDMPLLWALRDLLDVRGPKYSCGRGLCGACSVQMDGETVRSCVTTLARAAGSEVVTTEGLDGEVSDAVFRAWREEDVPQCGYCQTGMLMGAVNLLRRNPQPDDAAIDRAMASYLCRCGTYSRVRRAIQRAASVVASTGSRDR